MPDLVLAEFDSALGCAEAIRRLRRAGYRKLDAFLPHPSKAIDAALELPRSPIPKIALAAALGGALLAYLIQWWTQAFDYPLNVGSHPAHSVPAYVPITFETMVLFGSLATFIAAILLCRLPRLWRPIFEVEGFERAMVDRYFVSVDSRDPRFEPSALTDLLNEAGALRVVPVEEEEVAR
jgi:hypothetical protein